MSTSAQAPRIRSLYRRLLRELPARQPSMLANPSPVQSRIRSAFSEEPSEEFADPNMTDQQALDTAEQIIKYLTAQRMYTTLVERYNPGMNMSEEERTRLTARRVGMDLPVQLMMGNKPGSGSGSSEGSGSGNSGSR